GEANDRLLLVAHHLAIDGVSWRILLDQLEEILNVFANGATIQLGNKTNAYRTWGNYLTEIAEGPAVAQLPYWENVIQQYQALSTDLSSKETDRPLAKSLQQHIVKLDESLTQALLKEVHQSYQTNIDDILLSALSQTISEWSGRAEVIIALEGHGRDHARADLDVSSTVGWFTNLYPVALQLEHTSSTGDLIKSVKEQLRTIPHHGIGYGALRYLHSDVTVRDRLAAAKWDIVFNYLGQVDSALNNSKWFRVAKESLGSNLADDCPILAKLEVEGVLTQGRLNIHWNYSSEEYHAATIEQLASSYLNNLKTLIEHCQAKEAVSFTSSDYGLAPMVTYQELDQFLDTQVNGTPRRKLIDAVSRLSPVQEGMLFHHLFDSTSGAYIEQYVFDFPEGLVIDTFKTSWEAILKKHSVLRMAIFHEELSIPVQCTMKTVDLPFAVLDWSGLSTAEQTENLDAFIEEDRIQGFDFNQAPFLRINLFKINDQAYKMVWTCHHIMLDGWSMPIILEELLSSYSALQKGVQPELGEEERYEDYIRFIDAKDDYEEERFWKNYMAGFESPTLFPFVANTLDRNKGGGVVKNIPLVYDQKQTTQLKKFVQKHHLTANTLLEGVWAFLLSQYTGSKDIVFGITLSGRPTELAGADQKVGMFINTLPLRSTYQEGQTVLSFLKNVQSRYVSAMNYQYSGLTDIQNWNDLQGDFFDSILVFENYPMGEVLSGEHDLKIGDIRIEDQSNYLLAISIDIAEELHINFAYNSALLPENIAAMLKIHFATVLEQMITQPARQMASMKMENLSMLSASEKDLILGVKPTADGAWFNEGEKDLQNDTPINLRFETIAAQYPNSTAVVQGAEKWSYQALNEYANQIGNNLLKLGIRPGEFVGVYLDRSPKLVACLLGIIKAGAVYVPLDTQNPTDRIETMITSSELQAVITNQALLRGLSQLKTERFLLIDKADESLKVAYHARNMQLRDHSQIGAAPTQNLPNQNELRSWAYMLYTSGSTGQPKGAITRHDGALNHLLAEYAMLELADGFNFLQSAGIGSDISLWQMLAPILKGGAVIIIDKFELLDYDNLITILEQEKVSLIEFVPSYIWGMVEHVKTMATPPSLKALAWIMMVGEEVPVKLVNTWKELFPQVRVLNGYGPCEASDDITQYEVIGKLSLQQQRVPIGRPIINMNVFVLDENLQLCPIGVPGELCVTGVGVGAGYWGMPEKTAESFLPNPFKGTLGDTMYRTGDSARWLPDGNLEFLGRIDRQVKIRGHRVELGEIESFIRLKSKDVKDAHILINRKKDQERKEEALIAFLVLENEDKQNAYRIIGKSLLQEIEKNIQNYTRTHPNLTNQVVALEKGLKFFSLNKSETLFAYDEIFKQKAYLQHGITLERGDVVFDVGANIGMFSSFVSLHFPGSEVYAFEPLPPTYEILDANARLYETSSKIKTYRAGLSDKRQKVTFMHYPENTMLSGRYGDLEADKDYVRNVLERQLTEEQSQDESEHLDIDILVEKTMSHEEYECQLLSLSEIIRENNIQKIDLLKIDVERSELDVLAGIDPQDWDKIKQIVIEVHDDGKSLTEVKKLLVGKGFEFHVEQESLLVGTDLYNIYAMRVGREEPLVEVFTPELIGLEEIQHQIQATCQEGLPTYMQPSEYFILEKIPLNLSDKVDEKNLLKLYEVAREKAAPTQGEGNLKPCNSPTEEAIHEIWSKVLDQKEIGTDQDFFEIGGHSLLAMRVKSAINKVLETEVDIRDLFIHKTIESIAQHIESGVKGLVIPRITVQERGEKIPLSFAQERLWFIHKLGGSSNYHMPVVLRLEGQIDLLALEDSFKEIVNRHEVLRTTFKEEAGIASQVILAPNQWELGYVGQLEETTLEDYIKEEINRVFDFSTDHMLRAQLVKCSPTEHVLIAVLHHIAADGWSESLLINELIELYAAAKEKRVAVLPELPIQYADYAIWQRKYLEGDLLTEMLDYWQAKLTGIEPLDLPLDFDRPAIQSTRGDTLSFEIDPAIRKQLDLVSKQTDTTRFMLLLSIFKVLLYRYTGQDDICVGTPIANRMQEEMEPLIGFLVNTLALRSDLSKNPRFKDLLMAVKATTLDAYRYQDAPFEKIVDRVTNTRDLSRTPLFQVLFVVENTPDVPSLQLGSLNLTTETVGYDVSKFDLVLYVRETPDLFAIDIEYCTDLFLPATIARMKDHFQNLLKAVATQPSTRIGQLEMLGATEKETLLYSFNETQVDLPPAKTVVDLFGAQVAAVPTNVAVAFGQESLSYKELNERANQLAHYLRIKKQQEDTLVAICMDRSIEMVVAMLAVLKSGNAYVPIDPNYPQERIDYILADAKVKVVICNRANIDLLGAQTQLECVVLEEVAAEVAKELKVAPVVALDLDQLAYIIYTSGSTGQPKGVMITHSNLLAFLHWSNLEFGKADFSVVFAGTSICFDLSIFEIFYTLSTGKKIRLLKSGLQITDYLTTEKDILLNTVPSVMKSLLEANADLSNVNLINLAGEPIPVYVQERLDLTRIVVRNLYGPSEDTTYSTMYQLKANKPVWIGKPIANTQAYIVDQHLNLLPMGAKGELCLSGAGVAKGYLYRPELSEEKFLPNPFDVKSTNKFYRTGDLARWLPDGNLDFLGRMDTQVKIRGYRIELGEIEVALQQAPMLQEVVVLAKEAAGGGKMLVAYFTKHPDQESINQTEIRDYLKERLPEYMVPNMMMELEEMPLTPNGKVDKKALPHPDPSMLPTEAYVAPRNPLEEQLATIWSDLLQVQQIGVYDNFFELGGHSLLATRVISAIEQALSLRIEIKHLFAFPTIATLANCITGLAPSILLPALVVEERPDAIPLSFAQERLWFIDQLEGSLHYHLPMVLAFDGKVDQVILNNAFQTIINRHEVLRTVFYEIDGQPFQKVLEKNRWTLETVNGVGKDLDGLTKAAIETPFNLSKDHLLRAQLIKTSESTETLVLVVHHIVADGWSFSIFVKELIELYQASIEERQANLVELPVQYADYAIWQQTNIAGEVLAHKLRYWTNKLHQVSPLNLPTDFNRPSVQQLNGATEHFQLDGDLLKEMKALAQANGASLFMTLLAGFKLMLYRYTGQDDICVGTPITNRTQSAVEPLIGFFLNTLAVRTELDPQASFTKLLAKVKETTLDAYANQEVPFEKIVDQLVKKRDRSRTPLFQVLFTLQNNPEIPTLELGDLQLKAEAFDHDIANFDLTFNLTETSEGINVEIEYCTDLFAAASIRRMAAHYRLLLSSVLKNPTQNLDQFEMLPAEEQQQLLVNFNDTAVTYPQDQTLVDLFEAQVVKTPTKTALSFEGVNLNYQDLEERINQLANYLITQGVKPDALVTVCLDRSLEMVITILAIQKAGASYVPIDPAYPEDRIHYILDDTATEWLITTKERAYLLGDRKTVTAILLEEQAAVIANASTEKPIVPRSVDRIVYTIYTSGSTGNPKGVMITNQALVNFLSSMIKQLSVNTGDTLERLLAVTTYSFDIAYLELYMPLLTGAELVLASRAVAMDGFLLQELIAKHQPSFMQATPSTWQLLVDSGWTNEEEVVILSGGEAIKEKLKNTLTQFGQKRVWNLYGPTETTIWSTVKELSAVTRINIGKPIANTQVYILRTAATTTTVSMEDLVPLGVVGELCIAGDGLAKSYLNRPALTAQKFIANPFSTDPEARLYRTGDLARWLPNGEIECLGRMDDQVKVRGHRIELGEIETVLQQAQLVKECVVVAKEDTAGMKVLVAYLTSNEKEDQVIQETLRSYLKTKLPAYMVPGMIIRLAQLPMTPNGKIDKKALPEPNATSVITAAYVAPRNELESLIVDVWKERLALPEIGVFDDFFELGGHSLLATRVVATLRQKLQKEITIKDFFEGATVASLATLLASQPTMQLLPKIVAQTRPANIPMSFSQERLWFIDQLQGSVHYHMPVVLTINGALNVELLENALQTVINRHEVLRTVFLEAKDGLTYQSVLPKDQWNLGREEIFGVTESALDEQIEKLLNQAFDLSKDHMLRATILTVSPKVHQLVLVLHHIASDGWSESILVEELLTVYDAQLNNRVPDLANLTIQYADYALWERQYLDGTILQQKLKYWESKLEEVALLNLPIDFERPALQSTKGDVYQFSINKKLKEDLNLLAKKEGVTNFMLLLAAFKVLLYRYSGQDDICVGTPIANRKQQEVEPLIGFFINTLALRSDMSDTPSFTNFLGDLKQNLLEAYDHQEVPFEKIVDQIVETRDRSRPPLFQVLFSFHNNPEIPNLETADLAFSHRAFDYKTAQYELLLNVMEGAEGIDFEMTYCTDLFAPARIERMMGHYTNLLAAIVADPTTMISALSMLRSEEETQLLEGFNAPAVTYPKDKTVVELFTAQAVKTPTATALQFEDRKLSYAEVDEKAKQVAQYLKATHDLQPDDLVAIMMDKSDWAIIAILGILKAGAAYVPIDVAYPEDRKQFILEDTKAKTLIIHSDHLFDVIEFQLPIFSIDIQLEEASVTTELIALPTINLSQLAYVIYTSGSTGQPKGVMIEHGSLLNYLNFGFEKYGEGLAQFNFPLFTSMSFDLTQTSIFLTLLTGGTLSIENGKEIDLVLEKILQSESINAIKLTPAHASILAELPNAGIKLAILGGDQLEVSQVARLRSINPTMRIFNEYGPTEATIGCTVYELPTDLNAPILIGQPIANATVYLLDQASQLVPLGASGELCVGGEVLARAYLNRPALSAEKFLPHPFSKKEGDRIYRTGDLARWLPDGNLVYLGRIDDQVKIRGYRIELGEIETALNRCDLVKQGVVIVDVENNGHKRLVAYIVGEAKFDKVSIQTYLAEALPAYMVPSLLIPMESLPLNKNGKVDKKRLPSPDVAAMIKDNFVAPSTTIEKDLAKVWSELLNVEKVGTQDNFFELGGDSIITIQLVSRAKRFGYQLKPRDVFDHQTIAALAKIIESTAHTFLAEQGALSGEVALAPIQKWFFDNEYPEMGHFNQAVLLEIDKAIPVTDLEKVFQAIVAQHDALSFVYQKNETTWQQAYGESNFKLEQLDLTKVDVEQLSTTITAHCNEFQASLNIKTGEIIRVSWMKTAETEAKHRLFIAVHHLAIDGVSWRIFLDQVTSSIEALAKGEAIDLGVKTSSYRQWVVGLTEYANARPLVEEQTYWVNQLAGVKALPTDHSVEQVLAKELEEYTVDLDEVLTTALLQEVSAAYQTEINDILLTALSTTIANWTGEDKVLIALEGHGREEIAQTIDVSNTVGWFTNIYPVVLTLAASEKETSQRIKSVKEQLRSIPNKGIGYGALRYLHEEEKVRTQLDLGNWDLVFNYLGQLDNLLANQTQLGVAEESYGEVVSPNYPVRHKLELVGAITDSKLSLSWRYASTEYEASTIEKLATTFLKQLTALIEHCRTKTETTYTPSDFGLAAMITTDELDNFLGTKEEKGLRGNQISRLYKLSPLQEGMLFHGLLDQDSKAYLEQYNFDLPHAVNIEALKSSWEYMLYNHSILRTAFFYDELSTPIQAVYKKVDLPFEILDYSQLSEAEQAAKFASLLATDQATPFDFKVAPLMRVTLVKMRSDAYKMIWTNHHILWDGWSTPILLEELLVAYEAYARSNQPIGKDLQKQEDLYEDYINYIDAVDSFAAEDFWKNYLADFESPSLLPFVDSTVDRNRGDGELEELDLVFSSELTEKVKGYAQENHLTVNSIVQGVWSLLLSRYTGSEDVAFGVTVSGRPTELAGAEDRVGLYINMLPIRSKVKATAKLTDWLTELQKGHTAAREFQYTGLNELQTWLGLKGDFFDSIMVFENYPISEVVSKEWMLGIENVELKEQTNYLLSLIVVLDEKLSVKFSYNASLLETAYAKMIKDHFEVVLLQLLEAEQQTISAIDLLTATEKDQILHQFNQTEVAFPIEASVIDLFEAQVAANPKQTALVFNDQPMSYEALNEAANQLAYYLQTEKQLASGDSVSVNLAMSEWMIVGILAVLKTGASYVPIDVENPADRVEYIIENSASKLSINASFMTDFLAVKANCPTGNLNVEINLKSNLLVSYTSGSTNVPKAVPISNANFLNRLHWMWTHYPFEKEEVACMKTSISFVDHCWELFGPLLKGLPVVLFDKMTVLETTKFIDTLAKHEVSRMVLVPTLLREILAADNLNKLQKIRYWTCSGEALPMSLVEAFYNHFNPENHTLLNLYGSTEITADVSCFDTSKEDWRAFKTVPIGQPISNLRAYILDDSLQLSPIGVPGKIYFAGAGLSTGYLNDEALTATKFITNPFNTDEQIYNTGDLAKWLPDGNIAYLGRTDDQVKIRGYRIELGAIETVLRTSPHVESCIVLTKTVREEQHLVAYVVPSNNFEQEEKDSILNLLKVELPHYMIPTLMVSLEALPLNASGKVDKRALPAPDESYLLANEYVAPRNELEEQLVAIWTKLLKLERIGIYDNFFDIGGHSLLVTKLMSVIKKEMGLSIPMKILFQVSCIADFAEYIKLIQKSTVESEEELEVFEL
ncbi:MAG: non-ribosomal peptide synthase/polyketide synthase, partial [Saprospiraceae bacterium]